MKQVGILVKTLLASDETGYQQVMREWQRYQQLPPHQRGSFRSTAGVVAHWRREMALALLLTLEDHPVAALLVFACNLAGIIAILILAILVIHN